MYSRSEISQHFATTPETIRRWSRDFAPYLSPSANDSNKSEYTDDDMAVLVYIHEAYKRNENTDTIAASLASGQRGTWHGILENRTMTITENDALQIHKIREERDSYHAKLIEAEKRIAALEAQASDADSLRKEINELNREIGRLEARLDILREDKDT